MNCEQDEYVCTICGATLDTQFKLNLHENCHDEEAERVMKELEKEEKEK